MLLTQTPLPSCWIPLASQDQCRCRLSSFDQLQDTGVVQVHTLRRRGGVAALDGAAVMPSTCATWRRWV
jgi:hypothetical protein